MLVLTRKVDESIMIGEDIEVTVLSNDGTRVRLGIVAPTAVRVHRNEIYREIQSGRPQKSDKQGELPRRRARAR